MPETIFGLQADTVWGIIIGAVIGIITTWIFAVKERRIKEPCWEISSEDLVQLTSKVKGLELKYNSREIERLVRSKVTFWNRGKEVIKKDDIHEPLFIVPRDETLTILVL